jgi:ABC-type branched-subunit amino acid transport system ATPase component
MQLNSDTRIIEPVELRVENVGKRFGDFVALHDVNITCALGKVTALVGPNGAGKTTLFHVIGGTLTPDTGKVFLNDLDITGLPPYKIARRHVGRLFQDVRVFPDLSVIENVQVSFLHRSDFKLSTTLAWWRAEAREKDRRERTMKWLEFVGLADKADMPAGELSYGQQKLLALARIVALRPALLLLDEPTAALSPAMTKKMVELIKRLVAEQKLTTVLIEHNMGVVRDLADYIYFLHEGTVHTHGSQKEVLENPAVRELYMGLSGGMAI